MPKISTQLKSYRQEKGLTQEELAVKLDVTRQTINAIEQGKYQPTLHLAYQAAKLFGVPIEKLFTFKFLKPSMKTYDKFYEWLKKNGLWWHYKPADEREERLYMRAYKRAVLSLFISFVVIQSVFSALSYKITEGGSQTTEWIANHIGTAAGFDALTFVIMAAFIIAYIAGATAFRGEELELKKLQTWYWIWIVLGIDAAIYGVIWFLP